MNREEDNSLSSPHSESVSEEVKRESVVHETNDSSQVKKDEDFESLNQGTDEMNSSPCKNVTNEDLENEHELENHTKTFSDDESNSTSDSDENKIVVNVVLQPKHYNIPPDLKALRLNVSAPKNDFVPDLDIPRIPLFFKEDLASSSTSSAPPSEILIRPLSTQIVRGKDNKLKELIFLKARTPPSMPPDGKYGFIIGPDGKRRFYYFTKTRPSFLPAVNSIGTGASSSQTHEVKSSPASEVSKEADAEVSTTASEASKEADAEVSTTASEASKEADAEVSTSATEAGKEADAKASTESSAPST